MIVRREAESELALRAVHHGGDICRRSRGGIVATKESLRDIVTETDLEIERRVRTLLEPGGYPVLGEEQGGEFAAGDAPTWIVDPLDGTTNFASGMPHYAVSIGLWAEGEFAIGAVALPAANELYFTHGDRGAFLNGRRLGGSDRPLSESLVAVSFSGAAGDPVRRQRHYALFGAINDASRGCLRPGSTAANLCSVAAGRLQAAYGFGVAVWDVAGALPIVRQAGFRVRWRFADAARRRVDFLAGTAGAIAGIAELAARTDVAALWPE